MTDRVAPEGPSAEEVVADLVRRGTLRQKALAKILGLLRGLAQPAALDEPDRVEKSLQALRAVERDSRDLGLDLCALLDTVGRDQGRRLSRRRAEFGRELREAATAGGLECELLTADPLELTLPPFTVTVDLERNVATLRYARLPLTELPARPDDILAAHRKSRERLEAGWPAEAFFDALLRAYLGELTRRRLRSEDRLPIVDLLPQVALAYQRPGFHRDPVAANFRPYGRVRFAYDLARLRRGGALERQGWRLHLAPASGGATRDKQGVLYLEDQPGGGQYYLACWFTPTQVASPSSAPLLTSPRGACAGTGVPSEAGSSWVEGGGVGDSETIP